MAVGRGTLSPDIPILPLISTNLDTRSCRWLWPLRHTTNGHLPVHDPLAAGHVAVARSVLRPPIATVSRHAAEVFFASLLQADKAGTLPRDIHVLELGIGVGLFARYFSTTCRS